MGIALLKKINMHMPEALKIVLAPVIHGALIYNRTFKKQMDELKRLDMASPEEIQEKQFRDLKETLIHAYEHTKYYKDIFDKCGFDVYSFSDTMDLGCIPVLKKEDIIRCFEHLQADDIKDFYLATTGGSTGVPVKILLDKKSIYKERAFIYHFWGKHGYDYKSSRLASFRGTGFNGKISKVNPLYNEIQMNPCGINAATVKSYITKIEQFQAGFLHGFPSAIYSLCKYAKEWHIDLKGRFEAVFLISENVYDFQREFIERVLECKTYAFYGHSERAVFAEQSGEGYVFNPNYCYWQLDLGNNIVTTGFINRKMPLIRYELDDTARPYNNVYKIEGHRDGFLCGKNGEIISAAMLEVHSMVLEKIANYQFVQEEKGVVTILVVPLSPLTHSDIEEVRKLFQDKIGCSMDVYIEVVEKIMLGERGKYKLIMQNTEIYTNER